MELTTGSIVEGKVKSITKFGAFIALPDNQTGMVHISEITHAFVNDIHDHLTEGQDVKVMVIGLENGKINLSIRRTQPAPQRPSGESRPPRTGGFDRSRSQEQQEFRPSRPRPQQAVSSAPPAPPSFDDMLKQFMADSDSKISGLKQFERKTKTRRR